LRSDYVSCLIATAKLPDSNRFKALSDPLVSNQKAKLTIESFVTLTIVCAAAGVELNSSDIVSSMQTTRPVNFRRWRAV
jgi:hypothetical protein